MLKRTLNLLLLGAAGLVVLCPAANAATDEVANQSTQGQKALGSSMVVRETSFVIDGTASDPATTSKGAMKPYEDHESLPAGAIYTTSDDAA